MNILEEILVPQESVNDNNVIITKLFFQNGDHVKKGDIILEFETSKSIVEIESNFDGFIIYYFESGDEVNVGNVIAKIMDEYNPAENKDKTELQTTIDNSHTDKSITPAFSLQAKKLLKEYTSLPTISA